MLRKLSSPLSNTYEDEDGGSLESRMRLPQEALDAVRKAIPLDRLVLVPVSGTDWVESGWDIQQTIAFAKALEVRGCSAVHVSGSGLDPQQPVPLGPNYQVTLDRAVKQALSMPVVAVDLISEYAQASVNIGSNSITSD